MLATVLNWLTAGTLDKVLNFFAAREQAKTDAMTNEQQRAYEERLQVNKHAKEVRLATSGHWEMRLLTVAIALPFVIHLWLIAIDTFWPQPWSVARFPAPFDDTGHSILLSFFGLVGARAIAGGIAMLGRK